MTIIRSALLRALDPIKIIQDITATGVTIELLQLFNLPYSYSTSSVIFIFPFHELGHRQC